MVSTVKEVTAPGESQNMTTDPLETKPISVPAPPTENTQDTADDHAANLDLTQSVPVVVPSPHPLSRNSSDGKTTEGQSLSGLAPEILLEIIHHLDAPSLVCLALTSHRFYTLILQHFQVTRLSKLCPKNVRAPIPRTLRAHAYNILAPDTEAASKGWRVENLTFPPPSSTLQVGNRNLHLAIERVAYVHRVAWYIASQAPAFSEGSVLIQTPPSSGGSVLEFPPVCPICPICPIPSLIV